MKMRKVLNSLEYFFHIYAMDFAKIKNYNNSKKNCFFFYRNYQELKKKL